MDLSERFAMNEVGEKPTFTAYDGMDVILLCVALADLGCYDNEKVRKFKEINQLNFN